MPGYAQCRLKLAAAVAALLSLPALAPAASAYQAIPVGSFDDAIDIRAVPSQPRLLFIAEQSGKIIVLKDEAAVARSFLDIQDIVLFSGEQGLLSLAFAPDYETSGLFYVLFVNTRGYVEIDEFKRSIDSPLRAAKGTRRKVLEIPHPDATNHNGGQLHFGNDGYLYISIGDGGDTATKGEPARKLGSLLGKILRIDPAANGAAAYRIPPDNPFVGKAGRDEIFAYGLRNPYRFALDGTLITIGDVGEDRREEVDILRLPRANGSNFGWPEFEGDLVYDSSLPGPDAPKPPILVYDHSAACAIVGGHVVRDSQLPNLEGRYIYGDFCGGDVRSFAFDARAQTTTGDTSLGINIAGLRSFGQGRNGQVYIIGNGTLYRLEP